MKLIIIAFLTLISIIGIIKAVCEYRKNQLLRDAIARELERQKRAVKYGR